MPTHSDATSPQLTRNDLQSLMRIRVFDCEQSLRQSRTELAMRPFDERAGRRRFGEICARIDHALHLDVRTRLELQISLTWIS